MPKAVKMKAKWRRILIDYAQGRYHFSTRQKPRSGTRAHDDMHKIEGCPLFLNPSGKDLSGKQLVCVCSFHIDDVLPPPKPTPRAPLLSNSTTNTQKGRPSHSTQQRRLSPSPSKSPTSFHDRIPKNWKKNMAEADQSWIGRQVLISKGTLSNNLKLWYHPPTNVGPNNTTVQPSPQQYFLRRLCLWMPRRMWDIDLKCPDCPKQSLTSKGLYNHVRLVLDVKDFYYLAAEYFECKKCKHTFIGWDDRLSSQLTDDVKSLFPAVLTRKYAIDKSIVSMLRSRTQGNSPTASRDKVKELHSEEWLNCQLRYLADCTRHKNGCVRMNRPCPEYEDPPSFPSFPSASWFLAVYTRDVWMRLPTLLAVATSTFGSVLKIDSTKKICKKLQGDDAGIASWATNVGNERGEVVVSVLTESEGMDGLKSMADGLMNRYEKSNMEPPKILYTDRDCCCENGVSKLKKLFDKWDKLQVRLDVWHFMRRIAGGVTSESHPLYGLFMSRLSSCIFEWDSKDYDKLLDAKLGELRKAGVVNPTTDAARNAVSSQELARHCRRKTRGKNATIKLIESLILSMSEATDPLGVPLLREETSAIWREQKKHVACLQDPPGVALYTVTGHICKGGVRLQTLRCARGSTSLESFHFHLAKFIPGTSTNAIHYQAYLLDGLARWNASRSAASINLGEKECNTPQTFDHNLQQKVNSLSENLFGKKILPKYQSPSKYTGELFGAQYLYAQSGQDFNPDLEDEVEKGLDCAEEEGFIDGNVVNSHGEEDINTLASPSDSESKHRDKDEEEEDDDNSDDKEEDAVDSRGIGGWNGVDELARALLDVTGLAVTTSQAVKIKECYQRLHEFDKRPLTFKQVSKRPVRGRFARAKSNRSGHMSITAMKRCFVSAGSPAASPSKSRVVEAICLHLCDQIQGPIRERREGHCGRYISRWDRILAEYNSVRARVLNSATLLAGTSLALYPVNKTTFGKWYKDKTRRDEIKTLIKAQGLTPLDPAACPCSFLPQPPAKRLRTSPPEPPQHPHEFPSPEDTSGQAKVRRKSRAPSEKQGTTATTSSSNPPPPPPSAPVQVSRTTEWRRRVKAAAAATATTVTTNPSMEEPVGKQRKVYTCRVCGQPMSSTGHTQLRGKRYCPNAPNQLPLAKWREKMKEEEAKKKKKDEDLQAAQQALSFNSF